LDTEIYSGFSRYHLSEMEEALVKCDTTKGPFEIMLKQQWSPNGYNRAFELFASGFMDGSYFFRVVPEFLVQFGLTHSSDPKLRRFHDAQIPDDPQLNPPIKFDRGTVSFAGFGPNSRTSQLFISYGKIESLGTELWETPVGQVIDGMDNVEALYAEYGDMPPWGNGPEQHLIEQPNGREYMEKKFPEMDQFTSCTIKVNSAALAVDEQLAWPVIACGVLLCGGILLFFVHTIQNKQYGSNKKE